MCFKRNLFYQDISDSVCIYLQNHSQSFHYKLYTVLKGRHCNFLTSFIAAKLLRHCWRVLITNWLSSSSRLMCDVDKLILHKPQQTLKVFFHVLKQFYYQEDLEACMAYSNEHARLTSDEDLHIFMIIKEIWLVKLLVVCKKHMFCRWFFQVVKLFFWMKLRGEIVCLIVFFKSFKFRLI